jgi:hypothetical protein
MFVDHRLGAESWWEADSELDRLGFVRGWIFAPRQFLRYPKPSSDARPDDPAVVDRRRGDIVLDRALFREMRALGRWPLLMNVTSREVANLVRPDGQVARRLQLRPPSSADRVLHLVPAPLSACRLCRDGIATPAVGADVLAAPRLAGEARKAASARVPESSTTPRWSPPPVASIRLPTQLNEVEVQGLSAARIHAAIDAAGGVTTLAALVRALQVESDAGEERLRSELYNLRIEGLIDFERPLGRFSAIRRPRRAVSGDQGSS